MNYAWAVLFWVLGTAILATMPPTGSTGGLLLVGGLAYLAAARMLYVAMIPKEERR